MTEIPFGAIPEDDDGAFKRRRYRQKRAFIREQQEIEQFKQAVQRGEYPKKCLECIKTISYCCFWQTGFNCEPFDKQQMLEKLEILGV